MLPRLRMLDSHPVSDEERALAPVIVEQEGMRMAVMLSNACTVHKMVRERRPRFFIASKAS
jgi:hypothetical protein